MEEIWNYAKLMPHTIAVEGYPFSGKTTFIKQHFTENTIVTPDHMLINNKLPDFVTANWNNDYNAIIERQNYFLYLETLRCSEILSAKQKNKVMDRCVISILVYLLARIENHPQRELILTTFCQKLQTYFQTKKIFLPQKIIFIQPPFPKIFSRVGANSRKCEKFFLNSCTYKIISKYYKQILSDYKGDVEYVPGYK